MLCFKATHALNVKINPWTCIVSALTGETQMAITRYKTDGHNKQQEGTGLFTATTPLTGLQHVKMLNAIWLTKHFQGRHTALNSL